MSTGANCRIYEKTRGQWFYDLQQWPYGETPDYETYGPFRTFAEADEHLGSNHANPGGATIRALPGCPHDLWHVQKWHDGDEYRCDRCGAAGAEVEAAAKKPHKDREVWHQPDGWYYKCVSKNPYAPKDGVYGPYGDEYLAKKFLGEACQREDAFGSQVKELQSVMKVTKPRRKKRS